MNQSTYNSLKSFIWGIANDCLVDVYDVGDYRKIILPMFVIRRFDAVLEPKHEAVMKAKEQFTKAGITELDAALASVAEQAFVNKSDFTLTDLKSRTNQQQLKKDFIEYLDGFSENVQVIINKFHIRNEIDRLSEQQREIARQCDEVEKQINEMISRINKEITLVEELRTKLIFDVVTGQVDVRDVKIPIYEAETDIIDSEDDTDEENLDESMEE